MGKEAKLKQQRRQQRLEQASQPRSKAPVLFVVVTLLLAIAVVVAFVATRSDTLATAEVTVTGDSLATYQTNDDNDPAIGAQAPALSGTGLDGQPLSIEPGGNPMIVVFLAHWCPHCNDELDALVPHLADNPIEGVDLVAVSTFVDEAREHYPPGEWLAEKGWTYPTLLDSKDVTAGDAFGVSGTPFWVYLDADGTVAGRWSGQLSLDEFDATVARLKR